ncbi:MAG: ATP-binding protein [Lewinella sp.]
MQACPKPDNLLTQLRAYNIFENVADEALQWLIDKSDYYCLEKDEHLFKTGEEANYMQIVLTGSFLISRSNEGRKKEVGVWNAPYVTGVLPFSRMTHTGGDGTSLEPSTLIQLPKGCFTEMVNVSYPMTQALVAVMTERVRDFQQMRLMDEKLMALGKMSAGLAHELNNPASAMVRSSQELHKHLVNTPERFKEVVMMRVDANQVDAVNKVLFERIAAHVDTQDLSLMEREERTDDLTDWFEDHNIEEAEEAIEIFVDWDFRPEHLDLIAEVLPEAALAPVMWWLETSLTTEGLVDEIQTASSRIAELVSSIKTYSHMDNDPSMEYVDIHKGLASTLTMLKFRFKKKRVALEKTSDVNLPHIKALEGELNQVWTNLISNALEALPDDGNGKITIRSYQQRNNLCLEFEDNGTGIPKDIQSRVFDPFFTTKGIGEGTGMGLDIVKRVLKRHGGDISVESEPGRTCFLVCFPL